jgi:drug/metabolite transporter (DMT)-like permease
MAERGSDARLLPLALLAAVAAVSSAALFIRLAEPLPAPVIAALRVATTGICMAFLWVRELRDVLARCRADRGLAWRLALAAAMLALHFGSWIGSLTLTSVVRSVAIVAAQPVFAGLLGRLVGDRAGPRVYAGAAVAIVGSAIMVGGGDRVAQPGMWRGDALAAVGAASAAAYLTVGRSVGARLPLRGYLAGVNLGAGTLLVLFALAIGSDFRGPGALAHDYASVLFLGLVPGVIGHGLLNWAVRRAPVHVVSLAILLEPVGAGVLAAVALRELPPGHEALGAAVLLVGVAVGLPGRRAAAAGVDSRAR